MSVSTINATYTGTWETWSGSWADVIGRSSSGGNNGALLIKLRHPNENQDYWDEVKQAFAQWDTSSIPDNATISLAKLRANVTINNKKIGGIGAAISTMPTGWRTDAGVNDFVTGNILADPDEGYVNGILNFSIDNPDTNINKTGWTKFHIGQTNYIDRTSPGISAPFGDANGRDDFGIDGYNATNKPQLVITWTTPPVVTTGSVNGLQPLQAYLGAEVTDVGGGTVSSRGVCWSLSANPTTADSKAESVGQDGQFAVTATNLLPGTLYYYRGFVTTENSTTYGANLSFRTPSGAAIFFSI